MDRLYTPWRKEYISDLRKGGDCILCTVRDQPDDAARILRRGDHWYVVLNKYPYTCGHMVVTSNQHVGSLRDLSSTELAEGTVFLAQAETALRTLYSPQGLNVGLNLGRAGGAGVEGHLHWHILPRWAGDANFISVVGDTRVLPETLDETFERLRPHFAP